MAEPPTDLPAADPPAIDPPSASIPVARSPIATSGPIRVLGGWEVATRRSAAPLRLVDLSSLGKVVVRAAPGGAAARALGVNHGEARRDAAGRLVVGSGPDEWMILGPVGSAPGAVADLSGVDDDSLVTVVDLTHGRALIRVTGTASASLLAKLCAIDLSDRVTPNGRAFRSTVAKLVTDVVRDDVDGERSYLLHCERSSGQYLFDVLLDAGAELDTGTGAMSSADHLA